MGNVPMVSVLMPVYNGEQWLDAAIKSILMQSYSDFELLILLEYGSSKKSREMVYGYTDRRIRVIENKERLGLAASLNIGIKEARGKYIARMDADDISKQKRLEKQVLYLEKHPDIAICGTYMWKYRIIVHGLPVSSMQIRFFSFIGCAFAHPTVMWRRELFLRKNLFYHEGIETEDFEFWTRVLDQCKGANIPKPLLSYRVSPQSKSAMSKEIMEQENDIILEPYWTRHGMRYSAPDGYCQCLGIGNEVLRQKEWRLLELVHKTRAFKGKGRIVRKIFFDIYMPETMQVGVLVKHYGRLFPDLYKNSVLAGFQTFVYAVYRVIKRLARQMLISARGGDGI